MSSTETGQNGERDESNPSVNTKENDSNGSRKHTGSRNFRISNFKGEVPEIGAVIGTKSENRTKYNPIISRRSQYDRHYNIYSRIPTWLIFQHYPSV
mmetsp:Transcript_1681/g.2266  ORF Transcript_1681/g.2266 Transcript_1681/m.2266 type:complete len:97 (-) Transcript_1681:546-836(-)